MHISKLAMGAKESNIFMQLSLLLFLFPIHLCFGADSISASQSLSGDQTIVSSGGNYELGFFKPGNSSKYYIGIWYKKVSEQTVVWVANREKPVSNKNSSELRIVNGNLVLFDETQAQVWFTDTGSNFRNLEAVLLDEGNFVLRNGPSSILWQSLDYPTDTWLPGTRISYDKRTNMTKTLTSWKNLEDPSPGLYTLEVDPVGNQGVIMWNRSKQIWYSGYWDGQTFSKVPEMNQNSYSLFNFSYVSNKNETSFSYSSIRTLSIISRLVIDKSGQIKLFSWLDKTNKWSFIWSEPKQQCEVSDVCGAYGICNQLALPFCNCLPAFKSRFEKSWILGDYSGGCVRNIELECAKTNSSSGGKDMFGKYSYVKLPNNSQSVSFVRSMRGCKSMCLSNCSCTAYAYHDSACFTWRGDLFNMQQLSKENVDGKVIYIRLNSLEFSKKSRKVVYGIVGGSSVVASMILVGFILAWKLRKAGERAVEGTLVAYGYKDIQSATKNFSDRLGGGGFGSVFKGTMPDSTVIAVKKLEGLNQGEKQFRNEVSTIGNIQHVNLVHLRGFCSRGNEKLLVYEYMSKGSLDSHIFKADKGGSVLSWKTRYDIALGIAKGLVYLHEKCINCIIHCDVKPENILLNDDMCPKIADFGLAKLVGRDFSRVLTTMRGTRGYLAPEWISGAAITAKADVYSYGMMLFEFVSGRRNMQQTRDGKVNFFPARAANVTIDGGDVLSILDPNLNYIADIEEVTKICRLACWCIQDDENARPSMSQIVQILEGVLDVNLPPDPRSFQLFLDMNNDEDIVFFTAKLPSLSLQIKSDPSWTSSLSNNSTSSARSLE
ncbi:G-type lectin S-receptor-like serine/threonine-protein kinase At2g19130 [Apium graveolens]|uniref:G-type lectin S-receptor-like serine/threonine-protein kinase At2g19130 n=1 Tax=Apium graveolens TaxID=4045 RepID=UPI003D7ABF9D